MNTTDKPKCTAADGTTEVYNMPGVGLVVSAAAFNALVRDAERYRFALDDRDFAVCKFDDEKRRWMPIRNNETIDTAMQEKQS